MAPAPLYLTILRQGETIAMDLAEINPVVPRAQIQVDESLLTEINAELARITGLANTRAALNAADPSALADGLEHSSTALRRLGELIFAHLFPAPARHRLANAAPAALFLRLDDQLVHVPWELAFDGDDFLLSKFCIGRQVITHQRPTTHSPRALKSPGTLRMLIVVDPTESLQAAAEEAEQLCDLLDACDNLEVSVIGSRQLRKIELLQALSDCDLVHYAGHASFDAQQPGRSGWVLHDSLLTASEISRLLHPPLLVFSNACQAGATTRW